MPKLPSKWHCSGNYDDNNSSCDQWDNTSNYKHDISRRNNGDHVLQLAVMMSFVSRIIRKCMGQWQCSWGQIRISDKTKQANNRLSRSHRCRGGFLMASWAISEGNSSECFVWNCWATLSHFHTSLDLGDALVHRRGAVPCSTEGEARWTEAHRWAL